jgi:hypothetical protein
MACRIDDVPVPRCSRALTHFCSRGVTHPENTIWDRVRDGRPKRRGLKQRELEMSDGERA